MVPWQVDELARLKVRYELVWATDYDAAWRDLHDRFNLDLAGTRFNPQAWDVVVRAEELSTREVQTLMREHGPAEGDRVLVLWPFDAVGASLAFGDFVEHLDDLWAPGRDDIFVVSADRTRMLALDHEELLAFSGVAT